MRGFNIPMMTPQADFDTEFATLAAYGADTNRWMVNRFISNKKLDRKAVMALLTSAYRHDQKVIPNVNPAPMWPDNISYSYADITSLWVEFLSEFAGHPAITAYDLVNEPAADLPYWRGTLLPNLIRLVAKYDDKPCLIASGPNGGFNFDKPLDGNVIYTFHDYEPYAYTHQGVDPAKPLLADPYPGVVCYAASAQQPEPTTIDVLRANVQPVRDFQLKYNARIFVGEFSVTNQAQGDSQFIHDQMQIFTEYGWNWNWHCYYGTSWTGTYRPWEASGPRLDAIRGFLQ